MITNLIYEILKSDNTDNDSAQVLALIQEYNSQITSLEGIEYKYKSLKTLLGDNTNNWAKNKIVYEQYSRPEDASIAKNESLPRVCIFLNSGLSKVNNSTNRYFEGEIKIECMVRSIGVSSDYAHKIAMRIRNIIEPRSNNELNQLNHHSQLPLSKFGLSTFMLDFKRFDEYLSDKVILNYKVQGSFI